MVYFYDSAPLGVSRKYQLVTGKDKFENDMLIKWGYKELNYVWFHADKYSSGHVYLKLQHDEKSLDEVPPEVINDCLQLCKSMSIQGNKMNQCTILHTPWTNLRKNKFMKPGEVSFKSLQRVRRMESFARDQPLLNRLTKTRVELAENVEEILHHAKKTKDGDFFLRHIDNNRGRLIEEAQLRKQAKKQKKKQEQKEDIDEEGDLMR